MSIIVKDPKVIVDLSVSGNNCCQSDCHNESVSYNPSIGNFQAGGCLSGLLCCFGNTKQMREENKKTWEVFDKAVNEQYGFSPMKVGPCPEHCKKAADKGIEMTMKDFNRILEWANSKK